MKKLLIFIGCLYLVSCGDYHVSNLIFQSYCDDKSLVGQFIYQREGLTDEFFREIPTDKVELRRVSGSYYLEDKKYLIDSAIFKQYYKRVYREKTLISRIGPIYLFESYISQKSDGKKLGKSVSIVNKKGWLSETNLLWTNTGSNCPRYKSESGAYTTNTDDTSLKQRIFYKQ